MKIFGLSLTSIAVLALVFWLGSRYGGRVGLARG
jgi:hypothetical protein